MSQNTNSASGAMECPFKPGNSSNSSAASKQHQTVNENDLVPIPQHPVHWFTRNMPEITPTFPTSSNWRLAAMYGEIVKLDLVSSVVVIVSSYDLINEVYDESRFEKHVEGGLEVLREVIGDGHFSAYSHEKNWYKAHRILILAFDTIAICGFSYRFNSFYRDNTHPFAQQMADTLIDAGKRANRTTIENTLRVFSAAENRKNVENMWKLCDDLVAERKRNPQPDVHDVLNAMLDSADPETGEKLSDENIRFNMLTFLEVDRVVGDDVLEPSHLPQLKYLKACIQETLRVLGPITQNNVHAKEDTVIGGKYKITKDMTVRINLRGLHHDTQVWGADADVFRPERMLNSGFERMPQNAWKPFGNGSRSCIGRFLAEQEMLMALAMIFQRFQVDMADPSYDLHLKSTLTVRPADFKIKVSRRPGKSSNVGIPGSVPASAREGVREKQAKSGLKTDPAASKNPLLILYGSNAGTCKYIAEDLQTMAKECGLNPEVKTIDEATEHLPTNLPVVIISPSYEGKPADNARKFVAWVESLESGALKNVTFGVFGVGNSEWANTFHKVPRFLNDTLPKLGAKALTKAGFVDVKEDVVGPWEDWRDELLASVGDEKHPAQAPEFAEFGSAKRHMEVELPEGNTYEPGDYLVVMPTNPTDLIKRVVRRFNLNLDDTLTISGTSKEFLTGSGPVSVIDLIAARLELNTPASKRRLQTIARLANDAEQKSLMNLASSDSTFNAEVISKRRSILDMLEDFPSAKLSFAQFIDMLKPLAPRQYSISSSPLASELSNHTFSIVSQPSSGPGPVIASITYDVHKAPARSGQNRMFHGTASTYLASHGPGSKIRCYVRRSNSGFHLPADPETPIIMICAGTGLAPFRGFVQERACVLEASHEDKQLAPALLYFGCRDAEKDFLYREEFAGWEKAGAVTMRPTFSRVGNKGEGTWKYVHDRMWDDREELRKLFADGAKIYVCGSASKLAKSAADVVIRIWQENNPEKSDREAREWLDGIREVKYVSDVFD
ncbi:bifunctional P-450/NADPH-P450 reductase [Seiridium cupressi]